MDYRDAKASIARGEEIRCEEELEAQRERADLASSIDDVTTKPTRALVRVVAGVVGMIFCGLVLLGMCALLGRCGAHPR